MSYIYGFLAIALGAGMVIKTEWLVSTFGKSAWAESHLGLNGGTRLMYKLIGIAIILLSFMAMTGHLGNIILSILGPLFGIR